MTNSTSPAAVGVTTIDEPAARVQFVSAVTRELEAESHARDAGIVGFCASNREIPQGQVGNAP